ncbi:disintegrin and metalloproteinase domain-containing protein unc-71 isoform X4 [Phlebotomus papatasi]|uniref:disintegrin and metalloproteinase domain-containing protein unc-71 isoform X4 n=1 Tax=Phlebotomus papatasi TaxID=29031 RepID=UPI002483EA39|nr:disintegrin and metalloproteinase domain-containing protein unc-71 isoform X4 [Phlebotomus papatasi]
MLMCWAILHTVVSLSLCEAFHVTLQRPSHSVGADHEDTTHYTGNLMTIGLDSVSIDAAGINKREADYTLDDSFWNEESPVGEVERLLKEYRQNQELVGRIGSHYYQIIYPVQLRHHEKMGISTREVGASKVRNRLRKRDSVNTFPQRGGTGSGSGGGGYDGTYQGGGRGRSRTGKHFHRTSLLIKAFNHKFRLDLELNTQLLAPNMMQKHYLPTGYPQDSHREIEHCYYHGTVKDYPGASAAFHTCNGVSGVIHVGNETFVIHPFYGGDLSQKHPHIIFEARTKANKGCANSGILEWRMPRPRKPSHGSGLVETADPNGAGRYRRDVREATKYIETALIIDKAMFEKRNGSTRAEVVHDAIQVANIADLYFRTLNTRVSVVYIETWQQSNKAQIDGGKDISKAISNFNDYTSRNLFKIDKDTTQLLTGETFAGGEAGMSVPETVCTPKAVGISVDINVYEPHLLAGTMAHMIGHNIGMGHDDGREECYCRDWHGCIMAQSIVGSDNVQPYKFSECSRSDYIDALRIGHGLCLLNKPNELEVRRNCGNTIVEEGEECDCGSFEECDEKDPCCDPITCKLKKEAECASGPCCENCQLRKQGQICRDSTNECDLPEFCTGDSGQCPQDVFIKNGNPCGSSTHPVSGPTGYCFNGQCPTMAFQCERIWGYGGTAADRQCYEQFNRKGSMNGHCGIDNNGEFKKCEPENILCGSLQCKEGERQPVIFGTDDLYSTTIISIKGVEYECKGTSGTLMSSDLPPHGLVRDGTPCGDNLICVNQTCVSIFPHIDQTKCPSNQNNHECSGHGVCTNTNKCFCDFGWGGPDCSIPIPLTTLAPTSVPPPSNSTLKMERKIVTYDEGQEDKISTLSMVIILVVIVKCVFTSFALMAVCYRKTTRLKYDPPYVKKPIAKTYGGAATANHHSVEEVSLDGSNKLITYGNQATFREHKMQLRRATGSGGEEDAAHSEKSGILKKHPYGFIIADGGAGAKDKWVEDGQSDNMELMATQSEGGMPSQAGGAPQGGVAASEVERTLKSLNGYHEDILEALRNAASHRGTGAGNTPSGSGSISEELLRKTLQECNTATLGYGEYKRGSGSKASSKENICDGVQPHSVLVEPSQSGTMLHHHRGPLPPEMEDDGGPSVGPLRIRNLEDLIRQLEHHSSRHMSPSGSEDIRMSETEADRHYRLDSSAACSESSQGSTQQLAQQQKTATILSSFSSRCRPRSDDESRFVYGRYRHPPQPNRHPAHQAHSPHSFTHHTHHGHAHGHASHGAHSSHHSSHTHLHQDEEGIYESADRNVVDNRVDRDTPDSESDDFIQAQQQLARWASEDVVSVVVLDPGTDSTGIGPSSTATIHGEQPSLGTSGLSIGARDYYPSPPSTETESSGSVIQPTQRLSQTAAQQRVGHLIDGQGDINGQPMENTGRYPEYKH